MASRTGQIPRLGTVEGVGVVIATHDRPQLVRGAIESVLAQSYAGPIEVVVVFDRADPDPTLASNDHCRRVRVCRNSRTPGLAGARNTGILALDTDLIAFCDDDDTWLDGKLAAQLERLTAQPDAQFVTTAMQVDYGDHRTVRLAGTKRVSIDQLIRSRMAMQHSSSFLFRRAAMLGPDGFGLVDETLPRSMAEDWDLLIRASRKRPIEHVDEPLVRVLWGASSYFNEAWADKNAAHSWLIEHHPEIRADRIALGLQLGKLAFGHAALKQRREAWRNVRAALRSNWREPRTAVAVMVLLGLSPDWVTTQLNRRGHGI
jgi:glycosyltransferase involved in cell wall biosynthesis